MSEIFSKYNIIQKHMLVALFMAIISLVPELAYAAELDDSILKTICTLINMMEGAVGSSIATLAILFLGIGSFFGKANWGLMVTIAAGIGVIFGASGLAYALGVNGGVCSAFTITSNILDDEVGAGLCSIAMLASGSWAKGLSSLAIVFVGVACFFGKASWGMVITTTVGIALIFGAASMVVTIFVANGFDGTCLPALGCISLTTGTSTCP